MPSNIHIATVLNLESKTKQQNPSIERRTAMYMCCLAWAVNILK